MQKIKKTEFKEKYPTFHKCLRARHNGPMKYYTILESETKDLNGNVTEPIVYALRSDGTLIEFVRFGNHCIMELITNPRLIAIALNTSKKSRIPKSLKPKKEDVAQASNEGHEKDEINIDGFRALIIAAIYHNIIPVIKQSKGGDKFSEVTIYDIGRRISNLPSGIATTIQRYIESAPNKEELLLELAKFNISILLYKYVVCKNKLWYFPEAIRDQLLSIQKVNPAWKPNETLDKFRSAKAKLRNIYDNNSNSIERA